MKSVAFGFGLSLAFMVGTIALMAAGQLLGLNSPWWPSYWPMFLFMVAGVPFLLLLDTVPQATQVAAYFFPEGGASGVFAVLIGGAFFIWGCVFSCVIHFWPKIKTLTHHSSGTPNGAP